jgi:mannosyltransferase
VAYGVAITLLGYANLLAILLLGAHAVTALRYRDRLSRWLISATAAIVAVAPLAWVGSRETIALESLRRPGLTKLASLLSGISGTWTAFWWLAFATSIGLVVLVAGRGASAGRGARTDRVLSTGLTSVALPWLIIPPVLLFAASQVRPLFADRYLVCCLPALVLIVAAAVSRLPWPIPVALLVVVALLTWRVQHNIRSEAGHTEDLRNLALYEIGHAQSGDALLYLPARLRVIEGAYPAMTRRADDVALARSGAASGTLYGTEIAAPDISPAVAPHQRVWLVTSVQAAPTNPTDAAEMPVLAVNYRLAWRHVYAGHFVLELYVRN